MRAQGRTERIEHLYSDPHDPDVRLFLHYGDLADALTKKGFNIDRRIQALLIAAGAGLLLALCLAIPAGIVSAVRRNTPVDYVSTVVALLGQAMPTFWLGIMLILVFSVRLNWLPSSGRGALDHLILPAHERTPAQRQVSRYSFTAANVSTVDLGATPSS